MAVLHFDGLGALDALDASEKGEWMPVPAAAGRAGSPLVQLGVEAGARMGRGRGVTRCNSAVRPATPGRTGWVGCAPRSGVARR
ncbi:hypothetical protein [Catenuloplanes indicus]|uniref:Uncharacterized protein n=1 Tax=Catenuloplanes indicus TaxID=137267 RepID=A0AAE3W6W2_9ACTN|nr:hypothetical protein [Catenuloplanes indicus]MDQ0370973.1 hypothetical protein [Catenuloplanes indicus]